MTDTEITFYRTSLEALKSRYTSVKFPQSKNHYLIIFQVNTRNPLDTGGLILIAGTDTEPARGHQSPISLMVQVCFKMNILITKPASTINYYVPISGLTGGHSSDLRSSQMSLFFKFHDNGCNNISTIDYIVFPSPIHMSLDMTI